MRFTLCFLNYNLLMSYYQFWGGYIDSFMEAYSVKEWNAFYLLFSSFFLTSAALTSFRSFVSFLFKKLLLPFCENEIFVTINAFYFFYLPYYSPFLAMYGYNISFIVSIHNHLLTPHSSSHRQSLFNPYHVFGKNESK